MIYEHLSRGTADEEPLVDGSIDLLGGDVLVGRQRGELVRRDARRRVLDSDVGAIQTLISTVLGRQVRDLRGDTAGRGLASDETLPGLSTLTDDVEGVA